MLSFIGAPVHPVLSHQDKAHKKDSFDFDHDGKQGKRERIEYRKPAIRHRIGKKPKTKPNDVQQEEWKATYESTHGVADPVSFDETGTLSPAGRWSGYVFEYVPECVL